MTRQHSQTGDDVFIGRTAELQELTAAVDAAAAGQGSVWLVEGEPGIGKSRLVEELATVAGERGATVHWGRCWEAGGAPAYWPWIQILRTLLPDHSDPGPIARLGPVAAHLTALMPELGSKTSATASPPKLDPEQARFQLMDSVTRILGAAAERGPLVIVVEDLHSADPTSLMLLDFLARQIKTLQLMVVGTYREVEAHQEQVGPLLRKVARAAHEIRLRPLDQNEVLDLLERTTGTAPSAAAASVIYETSEGNPLYLGEIVSLLLDRGGLERAGDRSAMAIPASVKAVIQERADTLHDATRELLEVASVFGREFRLAALTELGAGQGSDIENSLGDAVTAHLVEETAPGRYRFTHILVREVFHTGLSVERRRSLHLRWAERLAQLQETGAEPRWSELAHHLFEAGPSVRDRAIEASTRAAERALQQLAFDDAAMLYGRAVAALDETPDVDPRLRCELLLDLASSQLKAGTIEGGRDACLRVAEMARSLGDAELIARAALRYGSVFVYAEVDRTLVGLLQEAADALGEVESGLRARVLARLAAALQPAPDTRQPIQMARDAIDMARRVGDAAILLQTIRAGSSAMMDLADPAERLALNQEHVELAGRLDDPIEALRGHMRTVIDAVELGRLAVADEAIASCHRIAEPTSLPHYQWPVASFRAMRAIMSGRFDDAERYLDKASELSERAQDPNARRTLLVQRFGLLRAREQHDRLLDLRSELERAFDGIPQSPLYVTSTIGTLLVRIGHSDQHLPGLDPSTVDAALAFGDANTMCHLAELAVVQGDRDLITRFDERLSEKEHHFAHWGMLGLVWEGPISRYLALIANGLGDFERADRLFERALEQARSQGALPMAARTGYEHARSLIRRGGDAEIARASSLLDECEAIAEKLELSGLLALTGRLRDDIDRRRQETVTDDRTSAGVPTVAGFSLRRDGESWACECEGEAFRLKDTKGVRMLARLVQHPGREFHVLDLSGARSSQQAVDTGDAGELLDDKTRAAYQRRVDDLRAEIEQAEEWNDPERAARAREELDLIAAELSKAFGLGGRRRRSGSASERARVNVQRRIKDAIARINDQCPSAGRHLEWAVRTGTFCRYDPS